MKCKVELIVAGKVFYESVHARDYQDAREVALARNPNATVVSVNADFFTDCLLYTSPSPRDLYRSRMPSSA